jgi:hypothetical protein
MNRPLDEINTDINHEVNTDINHKVNTDINNNNNISDVKLFIILNIYGVHHFENRI